MRKVASFTITKEELKEKWPEVWEAFLRWKIATIRVEQLKNEMGLEDGDEDVHGMW